MGFSIKIGDKYLQYVLVTSGCVGHSQLSVNKSKEIIVSDTPTEFSSLCVGNKVKEVIELMRFKDIPIEKITIEKVE
jgi:hypothetical protein